jgi:hypothetical protein
MKTQKDIYYKILAVWALTVVVAAAPTLSAQDTPQPVNATDELAIRKSDATVETKPENWVDHYDALLQKYVSSKGVKYAAWHQHKADLAKLNSVIEAISTASLKGKTKDEKLAFLLNAYNAWMLHRMLAAYPTKGPGGGGLFGRNKFFKSNELKVGGATTSFYGLENSIIRPKFKEPRIHFALNCASKSCPPLHTSAFRGETLDATLDQLAKAFLIDNPNGVRSTNGGKKLKVSRIFDWYEDDFPGGVVAYLNKFRGKVRFPDKAKVSFQDYDWSLNEAR